MENAQILDTIGEELGAELQAAGQSKVPIVTVSIEDALTPEHLAEYCATVGDIATAQKSDQKDLSVLKAQHHSVARLLAAGIPEGVVAELTGFTGAYISTLKQAPSMQELIAHYRAPGDMATQQIAEKLRTVGHAALERLMAEMGELDYNQLLAAAKLGADRSGNGPMSKVDVNHAHSFDLDSIRQLAADARRRSAERIVDISAVRQGLPAPDPKETDD